MDDYKIIVEQEHSTVAAHYEVASKPDGGYQSEARLEAEFIKQLQGQGYEYVKVKDEDGLLKNLRRQLELLNDEHGRELRSIEFARWLEQKRNTARRLVFVVGGPYGFSPAVYARANEKLSLSKMTFSHQMIRLIFTEQIYRACTIIKGEPYHHE